MLLNDFNPSTGEAKKEDGEFQASLGYRVNTVSKKL
jgi:hypothetical protein